MKYSKMLAMIQKALNAGSDETIDFCLSSKTASQIELWSRMLEGRGPWINKEVASAGLPAAISGEIARLITLELKSEITGSTRANYLQKVYQNKVLNQLRQYVEFGCAKGGLILKPYVSPFGLEIQMVQADAFFPISFSDSGQITGCVFLEQYRRGDKRYSRLEIHRMRGGKVTITNRAFVATNDYSIGTEVPLANVERWSELEREAIFEGLDRLPFGYFKVPLANAEDPDSPLGVSVYSRGVDAIRIADKRYSQLDWEFDSKEAAVHIANSLLHFNTNTQRFEMPAGNDRLYRALDYNAGAQDKPLLEAYSPAIREQSYINGFNAQLRRVEFACNLAYGTLSDPSTVDKTAEEIKSSKQRSYSFVKDCQTALQNALADLVEAMDYYATIYNLAPAGEHQISWQWDDSIVVDTDKERESDRKDVSMGIMAAWEYRVKWYGETEEQAKAMVVAEE